jgi:starch synthase
LKDTVTDGVSGFSFDGDTVVKLAEGFVAACLRAVEVRRAEPEKWQAIRRNAAAARFSWDDTAAAYLAQLYRS